MSPDNPKKENDRKDNDRPETNGTANQRLTHTNPFPGLRPFHIDEEHLFFGRESQVDTMVDKLAQSRFLSVVGTSGSGKSSLVNCGLCPALHRGLMAKAGTSWRIAQFRPGRHPIRNMARALAEEGVLFRNHNPGGMPLDQIIETTLEMSNLGLIDIYQQARLADDVNLLIVADQFEELFRFSRGSGKQIAPAALSEEAIAFVNLLLEAKAHTDYPIYVVLSMRSDFLGDCAQFQGLPEAINAGQYLVPRLTRDERRAAIRGPIGVGGATISPVLLTRLVNDVGDNPDQLSILQHALNRTWSHWLHERESVGTLDLVDYEAIGTMAEALDRHAEKAYKELNSEKQRTICEKLFKALTDKATDARGIRRPTPFDTLCTLTDASAEELTDVLNVFRKPSRSFIMPPYGEPLRSDSMIDISHESLMRGWLRLKQWADEEAHSAQMYRRLADSAKLYAANQASLYRDPNLGLALDWHDKTQPSETWAERYSPGFSLAMKFLLASKQEQYRSKKIRFTLTIWPMLLLLALAFYWIEDQQEIYETARQEALLESDKITQHTREIELLGSLYPLTQTPKWGLSETSRTQHRLFTAELRDLEKSEHQDSVRLDIIKELLRSGTLDNASPSALLAQMDTAIENWNVDAIAKTYTLLRQMNDDELYRDSARKAWINIVKVKREKHKQIANSRNLIKRYARVLNQYSNASPYDIVYQVAGRNLNQLGIAHRVLASDLKAGTCLTCNLLNKIGEQLEKGNIGEAIQRTNVNCPQAHTGHCKIAWVAIRNNRDDKESQLLQELYLRRLNDNMNNGHAEILGRFNSLFALESEQQPEQNSIQQGGPEQQTLRMPAPLSAQYFSHPLHYQIAKKLINNEELSPAERSLLEVYTAPAGDPSAQNAELLDEVPKYSAYMLLARAVAEKHETEPETPPFEIAFNAAYDFIAEFSQIIILAMLYPIWWCRQWYKGRFKQHIPIPDKPGAWRRTFAWFADLWIANFFAGIIAVLSGFIVAFVTAYATDNAYFSDPIEELAIGAFLITYLAATAGYLLFCDAIEYRYRRSFGKIIFMMLPLSGDKPGEVITLRTSARKNAFATALVLLLLLPAFLIGWVETVEYDYPDDIEETFMYLYAAISIVFTLFMLVNFILAALKEGRTLGDRFAKTRVVDVRSEAAKHVTQCCSDAHWGTDKKNRQATTPLPATV